MRDSVDDLYVRFFRLAERRIAERGEARRGVVCFISNGSWVDDRTYVTVRRHLLGSFQRFWVENMHGDRTISEYAPDGKTSQTIFAIPGFSVGIRQGVAISLWVRTGDEQGSPKVLFRDDLNLANAVDRRAQLLSSLAHEPFDGLYEVAAPAPRSLYSFRPFESSPSYDSWPVLTEFCDVSPMLGLNENRGGALQSLSKKDLVERMATYFDPSTSWDAIVALGTGLSREAAGFDPKTAWTKAVQSKEFSKKRVVRYIRRPLDVGYAYLSDVWHLWNRSRPELRKHTKHQCLFLVSRPAAASDPEGVPIVTTRLLGEQDWIRGHAYYMPFSLADPAPEALLPGQSHRSANLSSSARAYLASLGIADPDVDAETAGLIWMHALAVGYSPAYLSENADGIRRDWPRIPLPDSKEALLASAELGKKIAALLDTENPVPGVTTQDIRPELREIAVISRVGGGALDPAAGELSVTAGWGHAGKGRVTMPGSGKLVKRAYSSQEAAAMTAGGGAGGTLLPYGESTRDVYLNDVAYWRNVPQKVWAYTIGGYQVMKKWLSYREEGLLGRPLTTDEAREVTDMARRIAAILLLEPEMDENYRRAKEAAYPWGASAT